MRTLRNRIGTAGVVVSLLSGLAVAVAAPAAHAAAVINVPASQPTIQAAVDAAADGDTVVVAPGTYFEHVDFKGKAIEVRSSAGPASTTIDGGGTGPVVAFLKGESRTSVLRGFTVTHGAFAAGGGPGVLGGAGIAVLESAPTIVGNVVTGNDATDRNGGGIAAFGGAPLIQGNEIDHNRTNAAADGGGIFAGGAAEIVGNFIHDNTAGGAGGLLARAGTIVRDNRFRANHAGALHGGAVMVEGVDVLLVGNVTDANTSDSSGAAVHITSGAAAGPPVLVNNTFLLDAAALGASVSVEAAGTQLSNNIVSAAAGQFAVACDPGVDLSSPSHNDVYNTTASPYSGCTDPTGTAGNISADPLLSASYVPSPGSPVVDAGDNSAAWLPGADEAGGPRVTDGDGDGTAVVDMGALESPPAAATGDRYHPLAPARILDTRTGMGAPVAKVGPGATIALQVTGQGGVPATGVTAVVLNMTVTGPTADGWLTAWPAGGAAPVASNLNFVADQTVANLVVVKVGDTGAVSILNSAGTSDVVADVAGWYGAGAGGSRYNGLTPARVLDTRLGLGAPAAPLGTGGTLSLQVAGQGGVPAAGASAVVLNVTVTGPATGGWVTAWPSGQAMPLASNLNYDAGATVPNLVAVKLGAGGAVDLFASGGPVDVVADVEGWFGADGAPGGAGFTSVVPARVLDTRLGIGAPAAKVGAGGVAPLQVTGQGGVPATGVSAVVLNVTVTGPLSSGWITAWPAGVAMPVASNLNYVAGQTVPNLVVVTVGAGGVVDLFASGGPVDMVADVAGWYSG